jgi:hypothetical protein
MVNNQHGDNYTLLTVLAALVLFFAAVSSRLKRPILQWSALIFGAALFLLTAIIVAAFPVLV